MSSLSKMKELSKAVSEAQKAFNKEAKALLVNALKEEVFDKFENVEAVMIRGYAPYFNDGDPCVFSVGEPYIEFKETNDFVSVDDPYEIYDAEGEEMEAEDIPNFEEAGEAASSVFRQISDDSFESIFGSDQEVTFKRNGKIVNDDYGSHD